MLAFMCDIFLFLVLLRFRGVFLYPTFTYGGGFGGHLFFLGGFLINSRLRILWPSIRTGLSDCSFARTASPQCLTTSVRHGVRHIGHQRSGMCSPARVLNWLCLDNLVGKKAFSDLSIHRGQYLTAAVIVWDYNYHLFRTICVSHAM